MFSTFQIFGDVQPDLQSGRGGGVILEYFHSAMDAHQWRTKFEHKKNNFCARGALFPDRSRFYTLNNDGPKVGTHRS